MSAQDQTTPTRPGDALRAAGITPMSPWAFLAQMQPPPKLTPNVASELAKLTGFSQKFWVNLQKAYDGEEH